MLKETLVAMRDLPRLKQLTGVLIRHGLGEFAQRLHLPRALQIAGEWLHLDQSASVMQLPTAVRVRLALEELGPTFHQTRANFIHARRCLFSRVDYRI